MRFYNPVTDQVRGNFTIVADDESMTWETDPLGREPSQYGEPRFFAREGGGKGKRFTVLPGGKIQATP